MYFLSLFAGIGGFDLGLERAGHECVGQVEIDRFCGSILAARWPGIDRAGDIRSFGVQDNGWEQKFGCWPASSIDQEGIHEFMGGCGIGLDLLTGGFPCQDLSVAGKRAGLAGERSGLFWEIIRIAKALRPPWGLFENVPGLLSSHRGRDMALVLQGLRECWPCVGWRVLDSQHFGVAQRRRRLFLVGGPDERRVAEVLFEPEGGGGHLAAGGQAGAAVAASLTSGAHGTGVNGPGRRCEDDVNLVVSLDIGTLPSISGRHGKGADSDATDPMIVIGALNMGKAGGGWRAGPDEAHAGQLIVGQCHGGDIGGMASLRSGRGDVQSGVPFVTYPLKSEGHDASEDGTGRGVPMIAACLSPGREARHTYPGDGGTINVVSVNGVRRLTPTECERLQGFPDGWTCLCQPLEAYDHRACRCPDSPRYRALGNAVTVSVARWLGERLRRVEP